MNTKLRIALGLLLFAFGLNAQKVGPGPSSGGGSISACSTTPPTTGAKGVCQDTAGILWVCPLTTCATTPQWVNQGASSYACPVSGVSSWTCTHNLNTITPLYQCYGTSGVTITAATPSGAQALAFTSSAAFTGTCLIAGGVGPVQSPWQRSGTTISPANAGDSVEICNTLPGGCTSILPTGIDRSIMVAPTAAPVAGTPTSGGACDPGSHIWLVTFVSVGPSSGETTPSPASNTVICVSATGQTVLLSGIPLGPIGTAARNVYRNTVAAPTVYQLDGTIPDNSTTTYTSTLADSGLSQQTAPSYNTTGFLSMSVGGVPYLRTVGNNLFIGEHAGNATLTGYDNILIGGSTGTMHGPPSYGGNALTTGFYNTGVGRGMFRLLSSGNQNTAIGWAALERVSTGVGNTAMGLSAMDVGTSFNYNSAFGLSALLNNTADSNSCFGYGCGINSTTGTGLAGFGYAALTTNGAAVNNSGFGYNVLLNSYGNYNSAFGFESLWENSTGTGNSCFGVLCGVTEAGGNANFTGSNNSWFGYYAGPGTTVQLSNTFAVGYEAHPLASNHGVLGNSSVTDVYFGSETPSATSHSAGVVNTGGAVHSVTPVVHGAPIAVATTTQSGEVFLGDATGGGTYVTLNSAAQYGAGRTFTLKKIDASANTVYFNGYGTQTFDAVVSNCGLTTQWAYVTIMSTGTNWVIVAGSCSAI